MRLNDVTGAIIGAAITVHKETGPGLRVNGVVIVETKSVTALAPVHTAQLITYLKMTKCPVGLLINFNVPVLKQGIKRVISPEPPASSKGDGLHGG